MAPSIRPATADDSEVVARLLAELGYPVDGPTAAARLEKLRDTGIRVDLAVVDGRVVGLIEYGVCVTIASDDHVEILALVVTDECRGRGVGGRLVDHAVAWAQSRGCSRVRVRTNVVRERTRDFYEAQGFRETKTQFVLDRRAEAGPTDRGVM